MPSIQVQLTQADLDEAVRLHKELQRGSGLAVDLIVAAPFLWFMYFYQTGASEGLAVLVAAVGAVLGFCLYGIAAMLRARRGATGEVELVPEEIVWFETGIATTSRFGTAFRRWRDYRQWTEGNGMVLLYTSLRVFEILPRRVFADADELRLMQGYLIAARVRRVGPKAARLRTRKMKEVF